MLSFASEAGAQVVPSGAGALLTADSYLAAVRDEAASLPGILQAHRPPPSPATDSYPAFPVASCAILQPIPLCAPPLGWSRSLLSAFCRLQHQFHAMKGTASPRRAPVSVEDSDSWRLHCWDQHAKLPDLAFMLTLDYKRVSLGLKFFDQWVQPGSLDDSPYQRPEAGAAALWIGARRYWVFAFLLALQLYRPSSFLPVSM